MDQALPEDLDAAALQVLKQRLAERGESPRHLAAATGISEPTLYRKVAKGGAFTLAEWDRIASALRLPLDDLLEEARQRLRHLSY